MTELKFHRRHLLLLSALEKITSLTLDRSQNFEELSDFLNPEMDNKFPLTLCNNKPMIQGHYIWGELHKEKRGITDKNSVSVTINCLLVPTADVVLLRLSLLAGRITSFLCSWYNLSRRRYKENKTRGIPAFKRIVLVYCISPNNKTYRTSATKLKFSVETLGYKMEWQWDDKVPPW